MTKRLEILKNSLEKKEKIFDSKIENHFNTVKQSNGQPLNDKRNGQVVLKKWKQQNDSIRATQQEIEKTKRAIEKEQFKINCCEAILKDLPKPILEALEVGKITQWRKFPNRFFVKDGGRGRIIWQDNKLLCSHIPERGTSEFTNFANCFNSLKEKLQGQHD